VCGKRKETKTSVRASIQSLARAPQRHRVARRPTPEARRTAHVRALTNPNAHAHAARATRRRPNADRTRAMQHISTHTRAASPRAASPRARHRDLQTSRAAPREPSSAPCAIARARHRRAHASRASPRAPTRDARDDARRFYNTAKRTSSAHAPIVSRSRGLKRRNARRRDAMSSVSRSTDGFITLYPSRITTHRVPPRLPLGFTILVLRIHIRPCIIHTDTRTTCACNTS